MTLQLELGKKYLNRRGEVVEIVYHYGSAFTYSWEDNDGLRYTDFGGYHKQEIHEEDLVSEYVEPSTKPTDNVTKIPHPHADLIIAWAQGEAIQFFDSGHWYDDGTPDWNPKTVYRIKPEKRVDVFVDENATLIYRSKGGVVYIIEDSNIQLTVEDGKLIKAEVL